MKKHFIGIVFAIAVFAAASGVYFVVLKTSADFTMKLIFSGFVLLLALIVGLFASAVTRDKKRQSVLNALEGISTKGIAVYENGEFVFANSKYIRAEEKTGKNFFRSIRDKNRIDGYDLTAETSENGKSEYMIITVSETTDMSVTSDGMNESDVTNECIADDNSSEDIEGNAENQ